MQSQAIVSAAVGRIARNYSHSHGNSAIPFIYSIFLCIYKIEKTHCCLVGFFGMTPAIRKKACQNGN